MAGGILAYGERLFFISGSTGTPLETVDAASKASSSPTAGKAAQWGDPRGSTFAWSLPFEVYDRLKDFFL
jgi:hypothetical protein